MRVIFVDEASYLDCRPLYRTDQNLRGIKHLPQPFAVVKVIFIVEFFQLESVCDEPFFGQNRHTPLNHAASLEISLVPIPNI